MSSSKSDHSMRIGVSCLQIDPHYIGGVNTYTLGLLGGFASVAAGHRFLLYVTESNQHLFAKFRNEGGFDIRVLPDRLLKRGTNVCRASLLSGSRRFYRQMSNLVFDTVRRAMESEADILYVPSVVLQFFNARKPTVLSIHDIQHLHYPEFFSWARRLSRRITYSLSVQHTTFLQASSNFIKQDLLQHFHEINADQIEVIPEGVDLEEFASPLDLAAVRRRYHLPVRYLFYPAQLWPHKNHQVLLAALRNIQRKSGMTIPLVLTGAQYSAAPEIFKYMEQNRMDYVRYLGKVPFDHLVDLYHGAESVVAAGLYESNSLPVLEAAAAGTPIIASSIPPNQELLCRLQLNLFNPTDVAQLERTIVRLWNDAELRTSQSTHNRDYIAAYSWRQAAQRYLNWFERIAIPQRTGRRGECQQLCSEVC